MGLYGVTSASTLRSDTNTFWWTLVKTKVRRTVTEESVTTRRWIVEVEEEPDG